MLPAKNVFRTKNNECLTQKLTSLQKQAVIPVFIAAAVVQQPAAKSLQGTPGELKTLTASCSD